MQPQLRYDGRSREVLEVLSRIELPVPAAGVTRELFLGAGAALLPDWAIASLRRTSWQNSQSALSARALRAIAPLFRIALNDGVAPRACRRAGVEPTVLERWP
jgi:uncharacterized protein (DUF2236 family)